MWNPATPALPQWIGYRDFRSLNTKTDPHALQRNELQLSQNMWNVSGLIIGKRPGNINMASGATGSGAACQGMAASRFAGNTQVLVQTNTTALYFAKTSDVSWTAIVTAMTAGAKRIHAVQMFDPDNGGGAGGDAVFICNGVDTPWIWNGPSSNTLAHVATGAGKLPTNHTNAAPITPTLVHTLLGKLFYAGEPTEPTAVYVSDSFFPQRFTGSALLTSGIVQGTYVPYLIGRNDGQEGGDITGLEPLGSTMIVYKQSAIYRMDYGFQIFGDTLWTISPVSVSVGCMSPSSIARFDTFHCFLGIDGVYMTDGMGTQRISDNVPTFFDGAGANILDRTTAVGVRQGQRYLLFYDDGGGGGATTPKGYPTRGMWFDFSKPDNDGYPSTGEILGMTPTGVAELRGPNDVGNFAWCSGASDKIGLFNATSGGVIVYSDFGSAITATLAGKSDYMAEFFDPGAPLRTKVVDQVQLEVGIPSQVLAASLTFTVTLTEDTFTDLPASGSTFPLPATGGVVGSAIVGTSIVGAAGASQYQTVKVSTPREGRGKVISVAISETSTNPWNLLGYDMLVVPHEVEQ